MSSCAVLWVQMKQKLLGVVMVSVGVWCVGRRGFALGT